MLQTVSSDGAAESALSLRINTARAASRGNTGLYLIIYCIVVGTLVGGTLSFHQLASTSGLYVPLVTKLATVAGAVVGAAVGQLTGVFIHIVAFKSLGK